MMQENSEVSRSTHHRIFERFVLYSLTILRLSSMSRTTVVVTKYTCSHTSVRVHFAIVVCYGSYVYDGR